VAKATEVPTCDDGYDDEHDNDNESEVKVIMMMNPLKMNCWYLLT
jgi:hypothetical protein